MSAKLRDRGLLKPESGIQEQRKDFEVGAGNVSTAELAECTCPEFCERAADAPYVERMAKAARRTFIGQITWVARSELDDLYERNDREHRAIREAIAAGSATGARALARQHVLHSWELLDGILEHVRGGLAPDLQPAVPAR